MQEYMDLFERQMDWRKTSVLQHIKHQNFPLFTASQLCVQKEKKETRCWKAKLRFHLKANKYLLRCTE